MSNAFNKAWSLLKNEDLARETQAYRREMADQRQEDTTIAQAKGLPTLQDIFAQHGNDYGPGGVLSLMKRLENAGHGDSKQRWAADLMLNYGRSPEEIMDRIQDYESRGATLGSWSHCIESPGDRASQRSAALESWDGTPQRFDHPGDE